MQFQLVDTRVTLYTRDLQTRHVFSSLDKSRTRSSTRTLLVSQPSSPVLPFLSPLLNTNNTSMTTTQKKKPVHPQHSRAESVPSRTLCLLVFPGHTLSCKPTPISCHFSVCIQHTLPMHIELTLHKGTVLSRTLFLFIQENARQLVPPPKTFEYRCNETS